jgi:preprotein translocase subunit SecG
MLFSVLLAIHILVCIALVGVILLQRSEGGALGMGGGPSGFMTARGAGTLLTRATAVLGASFFILSLLLTVVAGGRTSTSVVDRLDIQGVDPSTLGRPASPPTNPATTGLPSGPTPGAATAAPGAIEAPRPTVQLPAPAPAAPAGQPATPATPAQ